ncbi:alpha/beta-gliadin A-II-like [Papaver somniferum]|uniref:alpha/beta-gliadin A-II-like n=1 Tax=Papaver somniferum TaxID=3469 RepID=UPI000E700D4D|nr:alpha/beta-gliadin A-II-like [Papaver somniferum]
MEKVVQRMEAMIIPTYEEEYEHVNVVFPNQRPSYANQQVAAPNPYGRESGFQQPQFRPQPPPQPQQQTQNSSLEEIMQKQDANAQRQDAILHKQDTDIKDLQLQMGQLATDMNEIKAQNSAKLPSQPFVNPRENVNVVTLRSGK